MLLQRGQVAVVTGAASGIGYGLAEELARRGLSVVVSDVRQDGLDRAAGALAGAGADVLAVRADVSDAADVDALAAATLERFGRVDLVCNNAGVVGPQAPMWEQDLTTWRWLVDIKLMGVVHGVRAFAPLLVAQGTGHIVNTASLGGVLPLPSMTPYNATMHAVVGMTQTLDRELRSAASAVGATVLCPGAVTTGLAANSTAVRTGAPATDEITKPSDAALSPHEVAVRCLAAVEDDRVLVIPNDDRLAGVRDHLQSLLEGLDAR